MRVLLADDEITISVTLSDALVEAGFEVVTAADTSAALAALEAEEIDIVLTDIRMPGAGGMAVLERSMELDAARPVIIMTGFAAMEDASKAVSLGAKFYLQKPFRNDSMVTLVETYSRMRSLEQENRSLRQRLGGVGEFAQIIGNSPAMLKVFERVRKVAPTEATVLIEGESGTGKERIALALHNLSLRSEGAFIAISCAALPESLLEAELFGYEKGAFTDARKERRGRFELADGGTIFLDDIDDMPLATQVKLLRVIQERSIERLGAEDSRTIDIRVLAATKVPLRQHVRDGKFRDDLFYRINVVPVHLPPLRERDGDVPALVRFLIGRHGAGREYSVSGSTMRALERHSWPGNVRELENAVQRGIALAGADAELALEDMLTPDNRWRGATEVQEEVLPLREVLRTREIEHIERALQLTGGHRAQTADVLGISRKVLWEKMRDHSIEGPRSGSADEGSSGESDG
ncbi:MAG: two-component system response regulator AtoC [Planctomycetota bacterium]|jgi:two-component system response regulator AtoC